MTRLVSEQPLHLGTVKAPWVCGYPAAVTQPGSVALPLAICGFLLLSSYQDLLSQHLLSKVDGSCVFVFQGYILLIEQIFLQELRCFRHCGEDQRKITVVCRSLPSVLRSQQLT